jgi:hypothetical protein
MAHFLVTCIEDQIVDLTERPVEPGRQTARRIRCDPPQRDDRA